MYVIGTAGHVDHGKSTLVKALTGIDPDRLQEEKARQMTIDLGFAWLTLPSGREVSVVDVPGHERFIKNMLAGVGGLDAALLVIAADEGPMPQTAEHLDILHLLNVDRGIVVITKRDLVDDEWLELVKEEVQERLSGTSLQGAPIVPVSARTGQGLDELLAQIDHLLAQAQPRPDKGRPRLPIDRAFTIQGFGTIVTGTLIDGSLRVGQEVVVVPIGLKSRIRGLQSHKHKVEAIGPGNRVAVNLAGVEVDQLERGMVLTTPGWLEPTGRVDVYLSLLPHSPVVIEQNDLLDFFTGSAETQARITLLDTDRLEPGGTAWAQLRLSQPVAVVKGDRYIVRRPSPSLTIGGGQIVDAHPRRHKRFHDPTLQTLRRLQQGTPQDLVMEALGRSVLEVRQIVEKAGLDPAQATQALADLIAGDEVILLGRPNHTPARAEDHPPTGPDSVEGEPLDPRSSALVMSTDAWEDLMQRVQTLLAHYHRQHPLRRGMSKEELRSRLGQAVPSAKAFAAVMALGVGRGLIAEDATTYRLPDHHVSFTSAQREQVERLRRALSANPYSPPSPAELGVDAEIVAALVDSGELVKVGDGLYYSRSAYEQLREGILRVIDERGEINVATMRDLFGTTRKYAIPFLEHLDEQKLTRRVGDVRVRW
jgi:selenocysteine-specific elongation factor